MYFETNTLHVIVPLDANEGDNYNEPVNEDDQSSIIENIYQTTGHIEDYINPTVDGELSWTSVKSYDTYSKYATERRKNKLYSLYGDARELPPHSVMLDSILILHIDLMEWF
jgi:hypothetical protein